MFSIQSCPLPDNALLNQYADSGAYTDCYRTEISGTVMHADYVNAFYTTWLFKLERLILKLVVLKPSSDIQARQLADGNTDSFSAWQVEGRYENQLLLSDFQGRTKSWLMVVPIDDESHKKTLLFFGSAVTRKQNSEANKAPPGFVFSALLRFHKIYSVLLLYSAKSNLLHGKLSPHNSTG